MYPSTGYCGTGLLQSTQKFRVRVWKSCTELPEDPDTGIKVLQNFQNFRVLWRWRTEIPKVPGWYNHAMPVPRVFVAPAYKTSRSSGYEWKCPTDTTEVFCWVIPRINIPGVVFGVPDGQNETNRKFGCVWVWMSYITHRCSTYGWSCTELTEGPGTGNSRVNIRLKRDEKTTN